MDHNGFMSALSMAVIMHSLDSVDELLTASSHTVHRIDNTKPYPVQYMAIDTGNEDLVQLLIRHGVDFSGSCSMGTALHCASRSGNVDIVDRLLALGTIDVDDDSCVRSFTPLHVAAQLGNSAVVRSLIDAGANVNKRDQQPNGDNVEDNFKTIAIDNRTPLHIAALVGDVTSIRHLLSAGADRDVIDTSGLTPFMWAASMSHTDAMDELLGNSNLDKPIIGGKTNVHLCGDVGNDLGLRYLLSKGADPNILTESGETPLIMVLKKKHTRCAEVLLKDGRCRRSINHIIGTSYSENALSLALDIYEDDAKDEHAQIYRGIISLGADLNQLMNDDDVIETLLMRYIYRFEDTVPVTELLQNGANPNIITKDGCALTRAISEGDHSALDLLFDFNVDVRTAAAPINTMGDTGISTAMTSRHLVSHLIECGCDVTRMLHVIQKSTDTKGNSAAYDLPDYLVRYIRSVGRTPHSLQEISRLSTLACLPRVDTAATIDLLDIPNMLKDYLNARKFAKIKEYDMKTFRI